MSIRLRLTLLFVALLAAVGLARSIAVLEGLSTTLRGIALSDAHSRIRQVRDYLALRHAEEHRMGRKLHLDRPESLPRAFSDDGMLLQLTAPDGRILNRSANLRDSSLPLPSQPGSMEVFLSLTGTASEHLLLVSEPLRLGHHGPTSWIQAAYPLDALDRTMHRMTLVEFGVALGAIALAFGIGYFFAGRALSPVASITAQVGRLTRQDLHRRLAVGKPPYDEIDRLTLTFNGLFDRLEESFEAQRRFVADASHELRSPLTAIHGHLQLIQRRGDANPEQAKVWLETASREVGRLIRLVNELLDLARAEGQALIVAPAPVELGALAREVVLQLQVLAPRIQAEVPEPLWVKGDEDRLRQVLINLVDNAVRATRDGGSVRVSVRREQEAALVTVEDTGCGIPPERLERIFDRFYRLDAARGRERGGAGLGLAIAQAIVRAHGGEIAVESVVGQGTRFAVRLPLG
ncbi:HAMP domain-containing protein [bacterium]|nr:HAMP domain-containing protein [bacterium]